MKRRELLTKAGTAAAVGAFAGCIGSLETEGDDAPGGGGEDDDTSTPTEGGGGTGGADGDQTETTDGDDGAATEETTDGEQTSTEEETTTDDSSDSEVSDDEGTGDASVQSRNVTTTGTDCGSTNEAAVAFDAGSSTVSVDGAIAASDPCHVATVERATTSDGTFTVVVGVEEDDSDVCQQCLGQVQYEARFGFADSLPSTVEVQHASQGGTTTVTTESRNVQPH